MKLSQNLGKDCIRLVILVLLLNQFHGTDFVKGAADGGGNDLPGMVYSEVEVTFQGEKDLKHFFRTGFIPDHYNVRRGPGTEVTLRFVVNSHELRTLRQSQVPLRVIIPDLSAHYRKQPTLTVDEMRGFEQTSGLRGFEFGSMGGYYTFAEVESELDSMRKRFPDLITEKRSLGKSHEGRDLWMVRISDTPREREEDEPQVLYTALHHAREPGSMMTLMYFMYYLLEHYGEDPEVTFLVDNRELYFIPVVNPDGYVHNQTTNPNGGGYWRKNMYRINGWVYGVDLNRNYGYKWGYDDLGSSPDSTWGNYRGPAPFSEPETRAIRDFLLTKQIRLALNYHTYFDALLYPWGYTQTVLPPDSGIFFEYAADMTAENRYVYGTADEAIGYATNGDANDWMYGNRDKPKVLAMTPEVGGLDDGGFWPLPDKIIPLARENMPANLYLARAAGGLVKPELRQIIGLSENTRTALPGDSIQLVVGPWNAGLGMASDITLTLNTEDPNLTVLNGRTAVQEIPGRSRSMADSFTIVIDKNTPYGHRAPFTISASGEGTQLRISPGGILVGEAAVLFAENFSQLSSDWYQSSGWSIDSTSYHSAPVSISDSPGGDYLPGARKRLFMKDSVDLREAVHAYLRFWSRWDIESNRDAGYVEASANGEEWIALSGDHTVPGSGKGAQREDVPVYQGVQRDWIQETVDLTRFCGGWVHLRFSLEVDYFREADGWYLDDIQVLTFDETPSVAAGEGKHVAESVTLHQNYPNPFNQRTVFRYTLPRESYVTLIVYDLTGRVVRTLVDGRMAAGETVIHWNPVDQTGQPVSSGVYLYRLTVNREQSFTRKLLLLR